MTSRLYRHISFGFRGNSGEERYLPHYHHHFTENESVADVSLLAPCFRADDAGGRRYASTQRCFACFRLLSEIARKLSEPARKPSELARKLSEPARKPSEPARKPSELARKPSELARKLSEPARKLSEPARKPSEPARKPSELARKPSEPARKLSEPARKLSEPAYSTFLHTRKLFLISIFLITKFFMS
jgi:hypothetical protein